MRVSDCEDGCHRFAREEHDVRTTAASAGGLAAAVACMSPATAAEAAGGKQPAHPDVYNV